MGKLQSSADGRCNRSNSETILKLKQSSVDELLCVMLDEFYKNDSKWMRKMERWCENKEKTEKKEYGWLLPHGYCAY